MNQLRNAAFYLSGAGQGTRDTSWCQRGKITTRAFCYDCAGRCIRVWARGAVAVKHAILRRMPREQIMATIDRRLLPLIEALAAVDADWLAFEILEGVQRGRVAEETYDDLLLTQQKVRAASRKKIAERQRPHWVSPVPAKPITGDDQINWVVSYVNERIQDVVSMGDATLEELNAILFTSTPPQARLTLPPPTDGITLVLQTDDEQQRIVRREDVVKARAELPRLRSELLTWAESIRTGDKTE
jgi:hypothetical protein